MLKKKWLVKFIFSTAPNILTSVMIIRLYSKGYGENEEGYATYHLKKREEKENQGRLRKRGHPFVYCLIRGP